MFGDHKSSGLPVSPSNCRCKLSDYLDYLESTCLSTVVDKIDFKLKNSIFVLLCLPVCSCVIVILVSALICRLGYLYQFDLPNYRSNRRALCNPMVSCKAAGMKGALLCRRWPTVSVLKGVRSEVPDAFSGSKSMC